VVAETATRTAPTRRLNAYVSPRGIWCECQAARRSQTPSPRSGGNEAPEIPGFSIFERAEITIWCRHPAPQNRDKRLIWRDCLSRHRDKCPQMWPRDVPARAPSRCVFDPTLESPMGLARGLIESAISGLNIGH
jgi:hypothetical protein